MEAQLLTVEGVKEAARKFYDAKKLTAQHPDPAMRQCVYQLGDYRCAIGASFSKETLEVIVAARCNDDASVMSQKMMPFIKAKDAFDLVTINGIQHRHDFWCLSHRPATYASLSQEEQEQMFLIAIDHPAAQAKNEHIVEDGQQDSNP